ncbi:MAG: hypothetical protein WC861_03150 [Candidatus Micrarchaeia archaeon]|jgi:hypothetical protein
MKRQPLLQLPSGLAAGLLEDGERALFLVRKNVLGEELLEVPCAELMAGENPVATLVAAFRAQAGIDAEVHEILFQRTHNVGTRKRRVKVPVLVFKVTAKSHAVRPAAGFSGYKWLSPKDMGGKKLSRKSEWLRQ